MGGVENALLLALIPALGNFAGGMLAEVVEVGPRGISKALHAAAGIVLAVVAVEIMPSAVGAVPGWLIALAFVLGAASYLLVEWQVEQLRGRAAARTTGMWMIYVAVAMDLFSDGLLIGTGAALSYSLAVVLALGQTIADVPEGFATMANLRRKQVPRGRRLLLSASFAFPALLAAAIGYGLLRGQGEIAKLAALIFTAGILSVAVVEEMIGEAHRGAEDSRLSVLAFAGGFALFALVAGSLGGG